MQHNPPPTLETFSHWPSWLNAYGNLDRSACFELRVSQVRRLAGCIPLMKGPTSKQYRDRRQRPAHVPNMPNERRALGHKRLISKGHYDITPRDLDWLAKQQFPRRLAGDWRTGRAPAMRSVAQTKPPGHAPADKARKSCQGCKRRGNCALLNQQPPLAAASTKGGVTGAHHGPPGCGPAATHGMTLEQGGHGAGERVYERKLVAGGHTGPLPAPAMMKPGLPVEALDAGLDGNPNRGACREKRFGLDHDWTQRLQMEKHRHASVSGVQYLLVCPGPIPGPAAAGRRVVSTYAPKWERETKHRRRTKAFESPCNRTAYKLFWVLARPAEHRDALLAEQWIASLDSGQLARQSEAVSALIDRYGPIMGDDRLLRCRQCLRMHYGKSPEASRKTKQRKRRLAPKSHRA